MRVAVSDFDGTLYRNGIVSTEDISAVSEWRKGGNVFGIATGRDVGLILSQIHRWCIPFDFLICTNGASLYDERLKLLRSSSLPDDLIKEVLTHPSALESMHYLLCSSGINNLFIRSAESFFVNDMTCNRITFEEALLQKELQQISLAYAAEDEYNRCTDALRLEFDDKLCLNLNGLFLDINKRGVNKSTGILDLLEIKGWPSSGLIFIGDGENDIPVIQNFEGFVIESADSKIISEAHAVYKTVGDMIKDNI